jgi:rhamnopyranosyl-N-acetylglucosaminyl-diphospho-decaprenol beta-1,3/1,4-galactofuranosyltransferase
MKVLAAIVTYNRCNLLERCLYHIQNQSRKPDEVIVINNGSTDNTESFLKKNNIKHINQSNKGSSGGWHKAIDYSLDNKFDSIWLMDDDGYPEKQALQKLIENFKSSFSCISSLVVDETNHAKLVFPMPYLSESKYFRIFFSIFKFRNYKLLHNKKNKFYNFCHLFNGALIKTQTIAQIGNVNINYFLYGDEVDYFNRLKQNGKIVTLTNCFHFHPPRANNAVSSSWVFYTLKNTIINNFKYRKFPHFYNLAIIFLVLYRIFIRNGLKQMFSYLIGINAKYYYKAITFGYKRLIGKNKPE